MKLKDKIALITGSSRGIGKVIAMELAKKGCKVIVNYSKDKDNAEEVSKLTNGMTFKADVCNVEECKEMIGSIISKYGKIDFLINNAGISQDKTFKNMGKEEWDKVIDTNLNSMFNVTKPVVEEMLKNNYGKIINISSVSGQIGFFGQTNYSAAKAGVIGFTKALAREVSGKGITVNAVAPGVIDTGLGSAIPEDVLSKFLENIPLKRVGKAEEIAHSVIFLLTNDYVTGQVINVNGGLSI
ncbi:beta-ketoacyl-ACP reductase [archaeon]|nr:beta-ketoacyl-ACP reductase [archaeon]|tara:strand:- start:9729 stop:10451 length:723 start_codon:yes stop_codon:yes gene_type:complete